MNYNELLDAALRRVDSKINEMCDDAQEWFFHDELCLKRGYHVQSIRDENGNWITGYAAPDGFVFYLD